MPTLRPPTRVDSSKSMCKHAFSQHTAAQDELMTMTICCDVMKNVENGLEERSCLLALDDSEIENSKKRKITLAADSIRNVTTILFAANKLLYSASQQP
jgi:hypothetical protein